jgi:hypothetical protein
MSLRCSFGSDLEKPGDIPRHLYSFKDLFGVPPDLYIKVRYGHSPPKTDFLSQSTTGK